METTIVCFKIESPDCLEDIPEIIEAFAGRFDAAGEMRDLTDSEISALVDQAQDDFVSIGCLALDADKFVRYLTNLGADAFVDQG